MTQTVIKYNIHCVKVAGLMMVIMNEDTFLCVRVELHPKVSFCIVIVLCHLTDTFLLDWSEQMSLFQSASFI